jgi:Carboxypeptidase regulatory-like domain/TonB dependent receptor
MTPELARAQGTDLGTIRGTVTDASSAAVPNANVTIIDVATNARKLIITNELGEYEVPALRSGNYKVSIVATGFNTLEISNIVLRPSDTARVDGRLEVGRTTESVVVQAEAPMVQTDNPTITDTLNNRQMTELPRDSRDYQSFLYLNPNITQGQGDGSFKFLGAQSYGASFSLDGQRSNGGVFGEPTTSQPSLETIGELTVLSNSFTAEYAGIANIRVTTRRGAADYHGSLFYDNKNSALAAWDLRDKIGQSAFTPTPSQSQYPNPYFNLNEFGGSFGGPVPKVKNTFFFLAFEKRFQNAPVYLHSTNLPQATLLAGDFSLLPDSKKPHVPAAVTLAPEEIAQYTVGGLGARFIQIPQRLLNPLTAKLIQTYFPVTSVNAPINPSNGRLVDYFTNEPGTTRRNLGTLRIDHDFREKDRLYGVYNGQNQDQQVTPVVSPFTPLGLTQSVRRNDTLSISETHLFTPSVINEARGGFNRALWLRHSNQTLREFLQKIGFNDADIAAYGDVVGSPALDTFGHPAISFGSTFATLGNGGRTTYRPLDQNLITFGDTLTWITGRHTLKAGADFVRNAANDGFTAGRGNPRGRINYSGSGTDPLARFLLGLPANTVDYVNAFRPPMDVYNWEQGFFAQDDFKIHPKVTLNLGLRYEIVTPFTENNNLLVNFDPNYANPNGNKGAFVVPAQSTLKYVDPRYISYGIITADKIGVPRSLVNTDYGDVAPRLGVAWRITEKSVLRGGYGMFYPTSAAQGIRDPLATNSFQVGLTKNSTANSPLLGWPGAQHGISPVSGGNLNALSAGIPAANFVPFDLKQPRIHQYNVTFEREVGWSTAVRVSYLGTRMQRLISGYDFNMIPPNDQGFATTTGDGVTPCTPDNSDCFSSPSDIARLPFPGLGSSNMVGFGNNGHGRSNAFQTEVNRRFAGGFTFNASYTYLDQKSTAPDTGNSSLGGTLYNQFNQAADYGLDAFVSHQRFITYGIYDTPIGRGRKYGAGMSRFVDYVVGGWQISWQAFAKSGTYFTPFWICDNCDPIMAGNVASGSLDATGGFYSTSFRPLVTGNPNVQNGDQIWDANAFALMPLGADLFSNPNVARRNLLTGPGTYGLNMGVRKIFKFGERVRAELGADFNNILNHPLKSPDNYDIGVLGNFSLMVDPNTLKPAIQSVTPNPDFGRLITSYMQEGVDSRRAIRLRLRITF